MESTINERLDTLIKALGFNSLNKFDKAIGVSRNHTASIVGPRLSKPAYQFLESVLETFPQVDARWLMTGKGEMFTPEKLTKEYVEDLEEKLNETQKQANIYRFSVEQVMARQQAVNFKVVSKLLPVKDNIILFVPAHSLANRADYVSAM